MCYRPQGSTPLTSNYVLHERCLFMHYIHTGQYLTDYVWTVSASMSRYRLQPSESEDCVYNQALVQSSVSGVSILIDHLPNVTTIGTV